MVKATAPVVPATNYCDYDPKREKWWASERNAEGPGVHAKTSIGSLKVLPRTTVPQAIAKAVQLNGDRVAFAWEDLPPHDPSKEIPKALPIEEWKTASWREYHALCRQTAKGYIALGLSEVQSVNILGSNSYLWACAAMGAVFSGACFAGIYPTDTNDQLRYKANHSDAVVAVCENDFFAGKFVEISKDLPLLKAIIVLNPGGMAMDDIKISDNQTIKMFTWEGFQTFCQEQSEDELEERLAKINPLKCCLISYTSGTTGNPKGAMLSHDNLLFSGAATSFSAGAYGTKKNDETLSLSYLPWSHVGGLYFDLFQGLAMASHLAVKTSFALYICRSYDLRLGSLFDRVKAIRPTHFIAVPRIWEKMRQVLEAHPELLPQPKKGRVSFSFFSSSKPNKAKEFLGLDRSNYFLVGSAPLSFDTFEFFQSVGIEVIDACGITESSALACWASNKHHLYKTVGWDGYGFELKIVNPDTGLEAKVAKDIYAPTEEEEGEFYLRGRHIMIGYLANPRLGEEHVKEVEEKNAESIDKEGWFHTGDKGARDARRFARITGRYKELIITAAGKNIAPVPIEGEIQKLCPFVSNAMMVGNRRKFNTMVVTLKVTGATGILPGTNQLTGPALDFSPNSKTVEEAMDDEIFKKALVEAVEKTNENEQVVQNHASRIQKIMILPLDFSLNTGELTASLKLRRFKIEEKNVKAIDLMYESPDVYFKYPF